MSDLENSSPLVVKTEYHVYTEQMLAGMRVMAEQMAIVSKQFKSLNWAVKGLQMRAAPGTQKAKKRAERRYQVAKRRDRARAWRNR